MTDKYDYKSLGFKAGLEIHQELEVPTKLFCNCPAKLEKREPDFLIKRFFRPVMGELGEFDKAMLIEYEKNKTIIYEGYFDSNCTYEIDETPPFRINMDAVDIGLTVTLMLKGNLIDELHVCRKNYLDGSVTCGFQRTLIVGIDGFLPLKNSKIKVNTISIEEDAARKIRQEGSKVYYRLDRLGIPLIEIVTDPVLESPQDIYEAAYRIGLLLRSTGKVKRGLGTVRQDINLSIKGGNRVELKGVQKLDWIKRLVDAEIERQLKLIEIKKTLLESGLTKRDLENKPVDLTEVFKDTKSKILKTGIKRGQTVLGIKLPRFKGVLGRKVQLDKSFGYEIAERVQSLTGLKGLIHSDENLNSYGISEAELESVKRELKIEERDAFAIVVGEKSKIFKAVEVIVNRCKIALEGVPAETRRALENGKSRFERELHGGARLYPDTDTPPIQITNEKISFLSQRLPRYIWELEEEYSKKFNLPINKIRRLILEDKLDVFEKIVQEIKIEPVLVLTTLTETFKALKRDGYNVDEISELQLFQLFKALKERLIAKEAIEEVLKQLAENPKTPVKEILEKSSLVKITVKELDALIEKIINKNKALIEDKKERAFSPLMGEVMKLVRGKIDGKIVSERLKEKLKEIGVLNG